MFKSPQPHSLPKKQAAQKLFPIRRSFLDVAIAPQQRLFKNNKKAAFYKEEKRLIISFIKNPILLLLQNLLLLLLLGANLS